MAVQDLVVAPTYPNERESRQQLVTPKFGQRSWGVFATVGWLIFALVVCGLTNWAQEKFVSAPILKKPFVTWSSGEFAIQCLLTGVTTYVACLLVVAIAIRMKGRGIAGYLGLNKPSLRYLALGACIIAPYMVLLSHLTEGHTTQPYLVALSAGITPAWYVFNRFPEFISVPIMEECLFRGFLWRGCEDRFGRKGAFYVTSALFAIGHFKTYAPGGDFNPFMLCYYFLLSMFYGWFRSRSGGISTTILLHGMFNLGIALVPIMALSL